MIEIFSLPFIQRAAIAGILIGFVTSYYGVFIVQRKLSFLGSGLAHSAFGGAALGLLLETEPLWVALPFTVIISILIVYLKEKSKLSGDTSVGILFSVAVALGIIFLSLKKGYTNDAFTYLFGSILSVQKIDLIFSSFLALLSVGTFFSQWKKWAYATFDVELAQADKISVLKDEYILSILISVTIVISIKVVGIVLLTAFLVIPAATARLISSTFFQMTIYSIIIGIVSSFVGLVASIQLDLPTGAVIILIQAIFFIISLFFSRK
ncbi:MAG TPA: metal ABC transporter permease [Candidatus Kapabacteria bacterium]|nr:metal ABC transporter permease [Candidatus Kapabacteria bacterium]HPO62092.1 metal ABC transporter permease [Candidatus Kapabacteria bacterium]